MKKFYFLFLTLSCCLIGQVAIAGEVSNNAQETSLNSKEEKEKTKKSRLYTTSGFEWIFSWADVTKNDVAQTKDIRFSLIINTGEYWHYDWSDKMGMFNGLFIRNIGFITKDEAGYDKIKRRSYTLGMPLGLKIGNLKKDSYIYGGGEYELLFHYKEKRWLNGDKTKFSEWFSERTNRFVPSLFVGMQFKGGLNVKFKYYLDDFLNKNYKGANGEDYSTFSESVPFYISLSYNLRNNKVFDFIR